MAKACEGFGKGSRLIVMGRTEMDPREDANGKRYDNLKIVATDIRKVETTSKGTADKGEQDAAE